MTFATITKQENARLWTGRDYAINLGEQIMTFLGKIEQEFKACDEEHYNFQVPVYLIIFAPKLSFERAYDLKKETADLIKDLLDNADAAVIGGPGGVVLMRTSYWRYFQLLAAMGAQANVDD